MSEDLTPAPSPLKDLAIKNAPTLGIVTAGVLAVALMMPGAKPDKTSTASVARVAPTPRDPTVATRLVSCGDTPGILSGDDTSGSVTLGKNASGCTLLFAVPGEYACAITGGDVVTLTRTDLVVANVDTSFTYACEAAR